MVAISPLPFLPITPSPLQLSRGVMQVAGTRLRVTGREHIPDNMPTVVVSNHRSVLDAPVLMTGLNRSIAFVCHHYMANVPGLRDLVTQFGAFPLDSPGSRQRSFFRNAFQRLRDRDIIGLFPEGAEPMVKLRPPTTISPFQRGVAHLALRAPVDRLAILPVALASADEGFESPIPLRLLSWFDPHEPLFQQTGGHPLLVYRRVEVRIGEPIWVSASERAAYRGRQGSAIAHDLTQQCQRRVQHLLAAPFR